jgi:PAS domain S-box-containing protein
MKVKRANNASDVLRKRAEDKLSELPGSEELSEDEMRRAVHELRVHQIELEMQNDALRDAQAELVESNSRYIDLYDFAPVGYLTIDEKFIILEANLTMSKLMGIEKAGFVGQSFLSYIAPKDREGFLTFLARIFETQERGSIETNLIIERSEKRLPALLEGIFVEDARGRGQCRISVMDISERKKAEEATLFYMKKLQQSNRELQDFAFIASHDLQEPLRKIQAFGSQLQKENAESLNDKSLDYLNRMLNASKRMSEMIKGLLEYSRAGTRARHFDVVDLARVVEDVESDLDFQMQRGGARIDIDRLPHIEADYTQMRQLFQNLISNSLKFQGDKKPVIKIYSNPGPDKTHQIFVEDNGIGFDETYIDRIFKLFERLHGRTEYEGTGLGLAICRRILERHHGSITAKSKPGQGATFIITLPEKQPAEQ